MEYGCACPEARNTISALLSSTRYSFDADYVRRLVAEDPEAERHFTAYFGDLLTIKLRSRLRSPALVEDARQETFVRVLSALKEKRTLESPESLGAFVNSVCNNVLFEIYRSGRRVDQMDDTQPEPAEDRPDAEAMLARSEEGQRVREALAALSPKEKALLEWLFFDERDKDDICRTLSVSRDYLRVLLHRAKLRFRERFDAAESA